METQKEDLKFWIVVAVACLAVLPVAFFTSYYIGSRGDCNNPLPFLLLPLSFFGAGVLFYFGSKRFSGWKKGAAIVAGVFLLAVLLITLVLVFGGYFTGYCVTNVGKVQSDAYWRGEAQPFRINEHAQIGNNLILVVQNANSSEFTLKEISVIDKGISGKYSGSEPINQNKTKVVNATMSEPCTSGKRYSYMLNITYENSNGKKQVEIGAKDLVGTCS